MVDSSLEPDRPLETQVIVADKNAFANYVKKMVSTLDENEDLAALEKAVEEQSSQDAMQKFLGDGQCHTLLVQKFSNKGIFAYFGAIF